ncbi:MAG: HD domain-containing protein [Chloroflexi bacterium]|nr:HD domain-containing protein [Chloroflexota bacterium]
MQDSYHKNKGPFIKELQPGSQFLGFYVLRNKQLEPFRDASRGYFLSLILSDKSGQLLARVWEGAEEANDELTKGEVIKVQGEVETYLDRTQARVLNARQANASEYDLRDMLPSSQRDTEEMLEELQTFIDSLKHSHLKALVGRIFGEADFLKSFSQAPAARRIHHAYIGGLIEHTLELLSLANTVIQIYPQIDNELLLAGVLLHDIGKVREYSWDMDLDYSDEGRLLGHIVMTDEMISAALQNIPDFPPELALRLRHMLLSHHGRYEWGSPRRPKTLEAIVLHHIDNLGAQINRFHLLLHDSQSDESWTTYDRSLRRQLYSGQDDDLNVEERSFTT